MFNHEINNKIVNHLKEGLQEETYTLTDDPTQAIYYHNAIGLIFGDFDCGTRGLDHNTLIVDDLTFIDLMDYGVLLVPESNVYISNDIIEMFENEGIERLPLDDNHFVGYK